MILLYILATVTVLIFITFFVLPYVKRQITIRKGRKALKNVIKRTANPEDKAKLKELQDNFTNFLKNDKI